MDTSEKEAFGAFAIGACVRLSVDVTSIVHYTPTQKRTRPEHKRLLVSALITLPLLGFFLISYITVQSQRSLSVRIPEDVSHSAISVQAPSQRLIHCWHDFCTSPGSISLNAVHADNTSALVHLMDDRAAQYIAGHANEASHALKALMRSYDVPRDTADRTQHLIGDAGSTSIRIALVLASEAPQNQSSSTTATSLLHKSDGDVPAWWDADWLLNDVVDPTVASLSRFGDWSSTVQVIQSSSLVHETRAAVRWSNALHAFVLATSGNANSSSSVLPFALESLWRGQSDSELVFAVYVPPPSLCPMVFSTDGSVSASVDSVGGITLLNTVCSNQHVDEPMQLVAEAITSQLRRNLGLGAFPCETWNYVSYTQSVACSHNDQRGLNDWEVDLLGMRLHVSACHRTVSALHALQVILQSQPNVKLTERAKISAEHAVALVKPACIDGSASNRLAYVQQAQAAVQHAESALYDHECVESLYFPTEQLIALFMPLTFPTVYPAVIKLARELVHSYKRSRQYRRRH